MHCWATDKDDATEDPVFGRVGKQTIENTGPLTTKRMETVNEEFTDAALDFIERGAQGEQALLRLGELDPHAHLHAPEAVVASARPGLGTYPDGMVEHDGDVGRLLDKLDELGIADNTHRHVLDRQRSRGVLLARRRHVAVPRREGHQLGGRAGACRRCSAGRA